MREIAWINAALKDFGAFPEAVQDRMKDALAIAGMGQKADIAKPMKGLGSGVFEIALSYRKNAYRAVYAVQIGNALWVVHAFQKKSTTGIGTPQKDLDLIRARLKRLEEMLG
ncbi:MULTISPECIES: type II toxin-antitoxin system RelE/ParE family toxin [unclassified Rhizobium]|uniref:type II toxin-antitoxin system RelE/ParE family toxin n=1 Tax=unclassified Rhizobium TaxID=2613769 RepID=UPI001AE8006A|nr:MULTISPECIES: type II toxin-antitoxin system RelE/ParE family toxin [unclassified Rhizobium]MBP2460615.1 phage-related protein [Rhizobium sp. PvP014]MBP2528012.1 phage-related protein [Rhizobium sp. PvP099]